MIRFETYNRLNKLSRYHLDGRYNTDNNGIENAASPVAVGRKIIYSVKMTIRQKARLLFIVLWDAAKLPE
jgi:hypothetical protein